MRPIFRRVVIAIVVLAVLAILTLAGWFFLHPEPRILQGEVEATERDVSAKIAARVDEVLVREGEWVDKGQVLLILDSPEIRAKLAQAESARLAARAQSDKARHGAREEEIRTAHNSWLRAGHAEDLAEKTFRRVDNLWRDAVLPAQRKDEAEANWKAARSTADAAKAIFDMAVAGTREEDRRSALALVGQASGVVSEVESWLAETRLVAPADGEVSEVIAHSGELIGAGYPLITLVDLNDVWATFNLREDQLDLFRMGNSFRAKVPGLSNREVEFEVTYISPLGNFATWRATNALGDFDLKTFEVRARPVKPVDGLRPGMSVVVALEP